MKITIGSKFKTTKGTYLVTAFQGTVTDQFGQKHQLGDVDLQVGPPVFTSEKRELDGGERAPHLEKLQQLGDAFDEDADGYFNEWEQDFISGLMDRYRRFGSKITITPAIAAKIDEIYEHWDKAGTRRIENEGAF